MIIEQMQSALRVLADKVNDLADAIKAKPDVYHATVQSVDSASNTALVVIDGNTSATPASLQCKAVAGDRVTILRRGVSMVAISRVGGDGTAINLNTLIITANPTTTGITSSMTNEVVETDIPEGYKFLCWVQPRTNGWIGSPYVGTWYVDEENQTVRARLYWTVNPPSSGNFSISATAIFIAIGEVSDTYDGAYTVVPMAEAETILPTSGKNMINDVTVTEIPYYEVSNQSDGLTAIIAELES